MRRRLPLSNAHDEMEKINGKQQSSRICLLAILSAMFWFLIFYFHFTILSPNTTPEQSQETTFYSIRSNPQIFEKSDDQDKPSSKIAYQKKHSPKTDNQNQPSPKSDNQHKPPPKSDNQHKPPPKIDRKTKSFPKVDNWNEPLQNHGRDKPLPTLSPSPSPAPAKQKDVQNRPNNYPFLRALQMAENKSDPCGGRYIYVHDLPRRFNEDMLKHCKSLNLWTDFCKFTTNAGLGPPLENVEGVFSNTGWHATNQFTVDVIFSNRMKQYQCLTKDSSIAAAVFVPFYAGFDVARYLWGYNISMRDSASLALQSWLMKRPEWKIMGGRDHFLVGGRITWDFRRLTDLESDWGNKLLLLPAAKNMTMLVVESSPWSANDYGIPYPTYFHPDKDADVFLWQDRMRKLERKWLFSFAGAPRPDNPKSIRGQLIDQCKKSSACRLLECDFGESKCHSPSSIMQMFQRSLFCLQPQGDSYTRRSAFDSMLAGCIPVFFHPGSAYIQYTWHLPKNYTTYSVFISEDDIRKGNVSIEERLRQISPDTVKAMREVVIGLIPKLIYADPRSKLETLKDAFDVSVEAIIRKVTNLRKDIIAGHEDKDFIEENSWKYALLGEGQQTVGAHEWDPFFSKPKDATNADSAANSAEAAKKSWKNEQRDHRS